MPHVNVGDIELYYQDSGRGVPVLLLHHFFGTVESWAAVREPLRRTFRTISVDLRAHGRSGFTDEPLTLAQMVADVRNLLQALNIRSAHLVGASIGAVICGQLAVSNAVEARSLTMIGVPRFGRVPGQPEPWESFPEQVFLRVEEEYRHLHRFHGPEHARNRLLADFMQMNRGDVSGWFTGLEQVGCPVLVMGGDNDPAFPRHAALELASRFTQNELCMLPRGGHLPHQTVPNTASLVLLDFLMRAEQQWEKHAERRDETTQAVTATERGSIR